MKIRFGKLWVSGSKASKVAVLAALILSTAAHAEKTPIEYWNTTGLKLSYVKSTYTTDFCASSAKKFAGCLAMINQILLVLASNAAQTVTEVPYVGPIAYASTIPDSRVIDVYGSVETAYVKAKSKDEIQKTSLAQRVKDANLAKDQEIAAIESLGKDVQAMKAVSFENLYDWIDETWVTSDVESFAVGVGINAFLGITEDPHTHIDPAVEIDDDFSSSSNDFIGIGASIKILDGQIVVVRPMDGSPALAAGLRANDIIKQVDGGDIDLTKETFDDVIKKRIRGPEGTKVTLTLFRKGATIQITITRAKIVSTNVTAKVLTDRGNKVGYIKINDFMSVKTCSDVVRIGKLLPKDMKGIILDLRGNPGGLVHMGICVASVFLNDKKTIMFQKNLNDGTLQVARGEAFKEFRTQGETVNSPPVDDYQDTTTPMVTLIDAGSASAAEIVAGALRDNARSLMIGLRSFGKGTMQQINKDAAKLFGGAKVYESHTFARFYQPLGGTNQIWGILADVEAYSSPRPTEDDMISFREEDEYRNALSPIGERPKASASPAVIGVKNCVQQKGKATEFFDARQDDAIPPDYQLLVAEDALACEVQP